MLQPCDHGYHSCMTHLSNRTFGFQLPTLICVYFTPQPVTDAQFENICSCPCENASCLTFDPQWNLDTSTAPREQLRTVFLVLSFFFFPFLTEILHLQQNYWTPCCVAMSPKSTRASSWPAQSIAVASPTGNVHHLLCHA